jgi:hypothetical protein
VIFGIDGAPARGLASSVTAGCGERPARFAALLVTPNRLEITTAPGPDGVGTPSHLVRADLDDDGADDLAVVFEAADGGRGRLYLLLSPDLGAAPTPVRLLAERDVWAAAALDTDADPSPELAVMTDRGLFIVDFVDGAAQVSAAPAAGVPDRDPDEGLLALRAGEIDGDGLPDLVLLLGEGIFRLSARPHR